jgi:murein DD-endopeptidase MepM/ murein hydrolase activator NlpD
MTKPVFFALLGLLLTSFRGSSQPQIVIIDKVEYKDGSTVITAENRGFAPFTVFLKADLQHMTSSIGLPAKIVVFPSLKKLVLAQFIPEGTQPHSYTYNYQLQLGICNGSKPDTTYQYSLPFARNTASTVLYAARSDSAHGRQLPIRFTLPEDTPVCAAREGIVASIKQDSNKSGGRARKLDANFIVIFHDDGTYAWYWHLRQNGSAVQMGQRVTQGEVIGFAGHTGWARQPCLGFAVSHAKDPDPIDVPVLFKMDDNTVGYLKTGQVIDWQ